MTASRCLMIASLLGFLAVFAGAFGAHGLKDSGYLTRKYSDTEEKEITALHVPASFKYYTDFETGVRYHMWHALAMLGTGLMMRRCPGRSLRVAAWCFLTGILLFSGTLYVLVIGGPDFLDIRWGAIAPVGGTLLLIGWIALAVGSWSFDERAA
ncbi:MAG: DUF423 domain-containing protein [Planctomycetaceae bacterium]|nr:DUF423 domain-containing protein [Planctomycetaceae bacterium]